MKTKKILSVLLALVMTLSLGAVAFAADDGYNWTPIPTSPEGLADGEYYLDFTDMMTQAAQDEGTPVSAEDLAKMIEVYNGGTWFIDYDAYQLKGSITVPADMTESGEAQTISFDAETGTAYLAYYDILREVGATWIPVGKSAEGLNDGDYYIDLTKTDDANLVSTLQQDTIAIYVNANADSRLMKYKFSFSVPGAIRYGYLPLAQSEIGYILERCPIMQYTAPQQPNPQTDPGTQQPTSSFIRVIIDFFQRIINFFRNLFNR